MNQPGFFGIFSPCVQVDDEGNVYALWAISFDLKDFPPEETHIYFTRSEDYKGKEIGTKIILHGLL